MDTQEGTQTIENRFIGKKIYSDKNIVYYFPCNEDTINKQQKMHNLCGSIWRTNFSAPIHERLLEGAKVLDIGCGHGIWIQEMCVSYPLSTFYGVDINSQLFPSHERTPKNSELIKCNVLDGLPFPSESFDFVHIRFAVTSYTQEQWINIVIPEIIRVCKRNGWIEHMEWDAKLINEGPNLKKLTDTIIEFTASKNINAMFADKLEQQLIETQLFNKVYHESKYCPVGPWFGDSGSLAGEIILKSVLTIRDQLSKFMNITIEEFDDFFSDLVKEFEGTPRTYPYTKTHRIYVQKK
ncbi:S-adenosyl-L-methionine-dependent methyltransferase [Gigaspora margarita]|uniref:S-adenosyl-L-methionine-dependent methyltransferase n=1 Tax=Gigaspora margarita TaxID=4874 RepID=A0A8H4B358_GIGMA|nr:S-adenosyl-L-methionine-dependent methyltransferase [Gigaspora margarita]